MAKAFGTLFDTDPISTIEPPPRRRLRTRAPNGAPPVPGTAAASSRSVNEMPAGVVIEHSTAPPRGTEPDVPRVVVPEVLPAADAPPAKPLNEIEQAAIDLGARCAAFKVTDDPSYVAAAEQLIAGERQLKAWVDLHDENVKTAHAAHLAAIATRERVAKPMREGLGALRVEVKGYGDERNAQVAAATVAVIEHAVAVQAATVVGSAGREFDEAVARGDEPKAARLLAAVPTLTAVRAIPPPPPPTVAPLPKVKGIVLTDEAPCTWDLVNEDDIPRKYMTPDRKMISGVVKSMGMKTEIPGILVRPESSLRVTPGRAAK